MPLEGWGCAEQGEGVNRNLRLGRVAGIPITARWSTVVIIMLVGLVLAEEVLPPAAPGYAWVVYWAVALVSAVLFLLSLLGHELAHSLVAQKRGMRVRSIELWMLGGLSQLEGEVPNAKADLVIAIAGPLASLATGALFGAATVVAWAAGGHALLTQALLWLAFMNVVLGVFNLLPGAPLDGGRVLRAILWQRYGDITRADLAAVRAGRALGMTFIMLGVVEMLFLGVVNGLWLMLIGWFIIGSAKAEGTSRLMRQALGDLLIRDIMTPSPDRAQGWQDAQTFIQQTLATSPQTSFPVVDFDGAPIGVITAEQFLGVSAQHRSEQLINTLMLPISEHNISAPADPAVSLLGTRPLGEIVTLVVDGHHLTGMITTTDLSRVYRRGLLLNPAPGTASATTDTAPFTESH